MQKIFTKDEIFQSVYLILNQINNINFDVINFSLKKKLVTQTYLHSIFDLNFRSNLDKIIFEIIASHGLKAELVGPKGMYEYINLCLKKINFNQSKKLTNQESNITNTSHAPEISDVSIVIDKYTNDSSITASSIAKKAIELAGFAGKIVLEKTKSSTPSVELVRGYTFNLQQLISVDASFLNPRVVCIDGHIENISELHHLLEESINLCEPCIIFARGMSEDVKNTLKVNYDRGSLRVIPYGVQFDLEGMNTLVDISVISGCDVVSSLKGELINNIKFIDLPRVDQVDFFKNNLIIRNLSTYHRVNKHLLALKKRRLEQQIEDVGNLLDKRIKSLSPNHVIVRLPDDQNFVKNSQAIDTVLRTFRSMVNYGLTDKKELTSVKVAAEYYSQKCFDVIKNLGAAITL
jgi:chaperonin GroEL (HSP60 family)